MSHLLASPGIALVLLLLGIICAARSIASWVSGLQLLVAAVLFGGIIGVRLGSGAIPVIFRDAFIVLPLYTAFFMSKAGPEAVGRLPGDIALGLCAVLSWLFISTLNPSGTSLFQLLIGLKVWIFYSVFIAVGMALAARPDAMFRTLRTLLLLGLVVCGVGLLQSLLIRVIGYQPAIKMFFGDQAAAVTQGFAYFERGGGIYRIPGTFSFAGQYVAFLCLYLTVAIIETNADPDPRFRKLGRIAVFVGLLAGVFSGTKGALLMFPGLASAYLLVGLIRMRLLIAAPFALAVGAWVITAARLDVVDLFSFGTQQAEMYSRGFIGQQVASAIQYGALGHGIGSSTGAARYVLSGDTVRLGFESYYAKIAAELGTIGLVIFVIFFLCIAMRAISFTVRHRWRTTNSIVAPLAIYIVLNVITSLKGSSLDVDPANIFFWLALGLMVGIDRSAQRQVIAQPGSSALKAPIRVEA